jgi:hypothetical protein
MTKPAPSTRSIGPPHSTQCPRSWRSWRHCSSISRSASLRRASSTATALLHNRPYGRVLTTQSYRLTSRATTGLCEPLARSPPGCRARRRAAVGGAPAWAAGCRRCGGGAGSSPRLVGRKRHEFAILIPGELMLQSRKKVNDVFFIHEAA